MESDTIRNDDPLKAPFPYFGATDLAKRFVEVGVLSIDQNGAIWRHRVGKRQITPRRAETVDSKGYHRLVLGVPGQNKTCHVQAHVLVWTVANGPIPIGLQINHKDLDKKNNRLSNLELVTPSENIRHSYANGRPRPWHQATVWRGRPIVGAEKKQAIREMRSGGALLRQIAERFQLSITYVQRIVVAADVARKANNER